VLDESCYFLSSAISLLFLLIRMRPECWDCVLVSVRPVRLDRKSKIYFSLVC
jgi:hypothetical protein